MKFDMGAAWSTATGLLGKNRDMILVVAGVFFFLPYLAVTLLMPQAMTPQAISPDDIDALTEMMMQTYADYWWVMLIIFVAQGIGSIALMMLLTDPARPTLGEALRRAGGAFLSYFAANLLAALAVLTGVLLPAGLMSALGGAVLSVLAVFIAIPLMIYLVVKFSLLLPAIAVDGLRNPVQALARSWRLTRGNSLRLFAFYLLLLIASLVVVLLATMVMGVVLAAIGGQVEVIGNAVFTSLVNAGWVALYLAVLAGVHRQLSSGPVAGATSASS